MKPMTGNFQVWGPPGCGKTTFIQNQVEKLHENGDKVLLCSLTRAAAGEMLSRNMKTGDESIGTLHKHCYHALGRPALTEDHLKEFNEFCQSERGDSSLQLSEFEYLGFRPEDTRNIREGSFTFEEITRDPHSGDYWRERMDCLRARMVPPELWPDPVTRFATCWQAWKEATGYMDFTDLIERGGWDCLPPGHPDVLIVDEAQDISKLEMECVVKQWGIHTRAVMLVGDPYQ